MTERTPRELLDEAASAGRRRALIVTALPLEMEAVVAHLTDAVSTKGEAGAVYETGLFLDGDEEWLIVVCVTGPGTHPAEMTATDAHYDFDEFEVQVFVGVAGSRKSTAPIGSVIAADQVYIPYSGKASEGTWSVRPRAIPTNYRLLELAKKVCGNKRWLSRVSGRADSGRLPPEQDDTGTDPIALVAPIVSTEAVLDDRDSDLEKLIASSCGDAHAVEMEGYGAQFVAHRKETPGIVVRGISDMAEAKSAHDDAMNQPIAARRAAAFAFELLSEWSRAYPAEVEGVDAVRAQLELASAELRAWPRTLPDGHAIPRPELAELESKIDGSSRSTIAVLGDPGSGKSALLANLTHRYAARGWPVLAIKADTLDPNLSSEMQLQEHLGLNARPSQLLPRLAKDHRVLLILDQLDALAGHLDLRTERLSILLGMVRRMGRVDNIHIVLSSRPFEFDHDLGLQAVSAQSLSLQLPEWSAVLPVLEARGIHAAGWPETARELMRTPQALKTYLTLIGPDTPEAFNTYQEMLDHLWDERILARECGPRRGELASRVAEHMAREETLWLPKARFDHRADDLRALEAEGVLTSAKGRIGFAHQMVFDHALARSFVGGGARLGAYVLDRRGSLFMRPKLWAGLNYLRAVDPITYHQELETIWNAPDLRPHLRYLLIEYLGHQADPSNREARLMEAALGSPKERARAYRAASGSPGWFARLKTRFITEAMSESDESADLMIGVLIGAWDSAPQDVETLLGERWGADSRHDRRTWRVLQDAPRWTHDLLSMACRIVERTDIHPFEFDHVVATVGVEQPDVALQLVRARLAEALTRARIACAKRAKEPTPAFEDDSEHVRWLVDQDYRNPVKILLEGSEGRDAIAALGEHASALFLKILWPWFEECFNTLREVSNRGEARLGYALPFYPDFRFQQEQETTIPEPPLLGGLRTAAEGLAAAEPETWLEWVEELGTCNATAAQRLIAHCFSLTPERYATCALTFLLEDQRRYVLGSSLGSTATSERLIATVSGHWTSDELERFEAAVKAYNPAPPSDATDAASRRKWNRSIRAVRLTLLRALPKNRLDARARRHIEQEERALPHVPLRSRISGFSPVESIMSADAIGRASDEDVINAFRTLPDEAGWSHPTRFATGGNVELAREFAEAARADPERAAQLLKKLDADNGTRAAGYALDAMAESADPRTVLAVMHDAVTRGFDGEEFRRCTSRAVERLIKRQVSIDDDTVAVFARWLADPILEHATNDHGETVWGSDLTGHGSEEEQSAPERSILWGHDDRFEPAGGDCEVLEAGIRIHLARRDFDQVHEMLCGYLDRCKDASAWSRVLHTLPFPYSPQAGHAIIFLKRLFRDVPGLVESRSAAIVLVNSHRWSEEFADSQLDRWRDAHSAPARQAYGEIVACTALLQPSAAWAQVRLDALIENPTLDEARAGAALSATHRWTDTNARAKAWNILERLLPRAEPGVWRAITEMFVMVREWTADRPTNSLVTALADAPHLAAGPNANFIAERLPSLIDDYPVLVARVAKRLVAVWRNELADARTHTAMAAQPLVDLAVNLHRLGPETREVGMELFEELLEIDAFEARQTRDEIDNRLRDQRSPRRPRLRRSRGTTRR